MKPDAIPSQEDAILTYLRAGHRITPVEALRDFSCHRLGARIHSLKKAGHPIHSRLVTVTCADGHTARVAEYSLPA